MLVLCSFGPLWTSSVHTHHWQQQQQWHQLAFRTQLAKQTQVRLGCIARCLKHKTEMTAELCSAHSSMEIPPPHPRSEGGR